MWWQYFCIIFTVVGSSYLLKPWRRWLFINIRTHTHTHTGRGCWSELLHLLTHSHKRGKSVVIIYFLKWNTFMKMKLTNGFVQEWLQWCCFFFLNIYRSECDEAVFLSPNTNGSDGRDIWHAEPNVKIITEMQMFKINLQLNLNIQEWAWQGWLFSTRTAVTNETNTLTLRKLAWIWLA